MPDGLGWSGAVLALLLVLAIILIAIVVRRGRSRRGSGRPQEEQASRTAPPPARKLGRTEAGGRTAPPPGAPYDSLPSSAQRERDVQGKAAPPKPAEAPAPAPAPRAQPAPAAPESTRTPTPPPAAPMPLPTGSAPAQPKSVVGEDKGDYVAVTVHYGTDRKDLGPQPDNPAARYNHERADISGGKSPMSYGTCVVSIPRSHEVGGLEDRTWWQWATLQRREPGKHVLVLDVTSTTPTVFFQTLSAAVQRSSKRDAFVFVHGFNVSFADAARRTAQMAYDLKFEGAPIFFSWPTPELSVGLLASYTTSESNVDLSKHRFRELLKDVLERTGAETVHIIAHSMGNRIVTEALQMLDTVQTQDLRARIGEVILTAPDIDASVFITEIAPRITRLAPRVTLYASSKDKVLEMSQNVHTFPRIGEFQSLITVPRGIEVVDASAVYDKDSMGHSYYGDSEPVIGDMCLLLNLGLRAAQRTLTLTSARTPAGDPCWRILQRPMEQIYAAIATRIS